MGLSIQEKKGKKQIFKMATETAILYFQSEQF